MLPTSVTTSSFAKQSGISLFPEGFVYLSLHGQMLIGAERLVWLNGVISILSCVQK